MHTARSTTITMSLCVAAVLVLPDDASAAEPHPAALRAVLVDPESVTAAAVVRWKSEGFRALVLDLDDSHVADVYARSAEFAGAEHLPVYYWIEVGRNLALAREHPEWLSALGRHDDWHRRHPHAPLPKTGEVAKAWPWVPIGYRGAFTAHLARINRSLQRVPKGFRGLLLNDLQGGPASCGCGNLQCRWAYDYGVPATADSLEGPDIAARFLTEVRRHAPDKELIPIWTIECEEADLPQRDPDKPSTGLCGSVRCAGSRCPSEWTKQWSALLDSHRGPVGLLALHGELGRNGARYGDSARWIDDALRYVEQTPKAHGGASLPRSRLWLVIQGYELPAAEIEAAERRALQSGAAAVVVARRRIDQSYEPRIVVAKPRRRAR